MLRKAAVVVAVAATGCASIVQGPVQRVSFETQPPGATVRADMQTCTTPCSLALKRNRNVEARIAKDGFATENVLVRYELDPWILGNLAFLPFAPVGGAVDIVSGAGFQLYPAAVNIPLRPSETRPPETRASEAERIAPPSAPDRGDSARERQRVAPERTTPPEPDDGWKPIPNGRDL